MTAIEAAAIAERHHLRVTIRGDGSVYGHPGDLQKLRDLMALRPLRKTA